MKGLLFLILFQLLLFRRKSCLLKGIFCTVVGGAGTLLLLSSTGLALPLTKGTLLFSGAAGLPGVLLLSLLYVLPNLL